jgi:hypothetical protein
MGKMKELAFELGMLEDDYIAEQPALPKTFPPVRVPTRIGVHTLHNLSRTPEAFIAWCEDRTAFGDRYYAEWQDPVEGYTVHHARYRVADWNITFLLERGEVSQFDYTHITAD